MGEGFEFLVIGMGVERLIEGEEALTGEAEGVERREGGVGDGVGGSRSLLPKLLVSSELSLSDGREDSVDIGARVVGLASSFSLPTFLSPLVGGEEGLLLSGGKGEIGGEVQGLVTIWTELVFSDRSRVCPSEKG